MLWWWELLRDFTLIRNEASPESLKLMNIDISNQICYRPSTWSVWMVCKVLTHMSLRIDIIMWTTRACCHQKDMCWYRWLHSNCLGLMAHVQACWQAHADPGVAAHVSCSLVQCPSLLWCAVHHRHNTCIDDLKSYVIIDCSTRHKLQMMSTCILGPAIKCFHVVELEVSPRSDFGCIPVQAA